MRELRNSVPGWIFCIVFVSHLVSSQKFMHWFIDMLKGFSFFTGNNETFFSILLGIFTIFGAEAAGYIFSSLIFGYFNMRGGYHRIWKDNFDARYLDEFKKKLTGIPLTSKHEKVLTTDLDNIFSFYWQTSKNKELVEWVSRRFTTYFLNLSISLAMAIGYLASWWARWATGDRYPDITLLVIILVVSLVLYNNARHTIRDAVNVIIIWLYHNFSTEGK
jgi:hypothetical protein